MTISEDDSGRRHQETANKVTGTAKTIVDDATKKGFTPISIKRVTAPGASFVWSVEKTK